MAPEPPAAPTPDPDETVQMNVRVKRSIVDQIDARRAPLDLSRDKWVARALTWALAQPQPSRHPLTASTGNRTAPPPPRS